MNERTLARVGRALPLDHDAELADTDRARWLELRRGGIGGSDVSAIVGLRKGINKVYESKVNPAPPAPRKGVGNVLGRVGRHMEGLIAELWTELTGLSVVKVPTLVDPDTPWMRASPDGLIVSPTGEQLGGCEWKRPSAYTAADWTDDEYPLKAHVQCVWYMRITGLRRWDLLALVGDATPMLYRVPYDEELAEVLVEEAGAFWTEHVEARVPPPPETEEERRARLLARYPRGSGLVVEAGPVEDELAERVLELRDQRDELNRQLSALQNDLLERLGGASGFEGASWRLKWSEARGSTLWKRVAEQLADLVAGASGFEGDARRIAAANLLRELGRNNRSEPSRRLTINRKGKR